MLSQPIVSAGWAPLAVVRTSRSGGRVFKGRRWTRSITANGRIRHTVYGMCEKHYPLTDEQMDAIEKGCAERVAADKARTLN